MIAEHIATLGGVADGRIQTTAKNTSLYEYSLETQGGAGTADLFTNSRARPTSSSGLSRLTWPEAIRGRGPSRR